MHAYYAERAPYYDAVYLKPERQADISFISSYLIDQFRGLNVLEIACGTGYWTQHIAKSASRLLASDGTAEPLELPKLRPRHGCEVTYVLADAYNLGAQLDQFNAAFAGLWFSHIPIALRANFLAGLHQRLQAGAKVILIDNNHVQLRDFPITESDAEGNTFQQRPLNDGSTHRVLKNFPTERELVELVAPCASNMRWRQLDNFWLFEYVFDSAA